MSRGPGKHGGGRGLDTEVLLSHHGGGAAGAGGGRGGLTPGEGDRARETVDSGKGTPC
jgi:hypothetical protein